MVKVTKESLAERVKQLERQHRVFGITINEEYQLEAYRILFDLLSEHASGCIHDYGHIGYGRCECRKCGKTV